MKGLDYRQLRDMFRLVREVRGESVVQREWARCTFTDLCAIRVIVDLFGGPSAMRANGRLQLKVLRTICMRLRKMGFSNPLLQVKLTRLDSGIVAQADGIRFQAATGQVLIDSIYEHAAKASVHKPNAARVDLKHEVMRVKRSSRRCVFSSDYQVPLHGVKR